MEHGQVAQELPQLFDSLVATLQQTLDTSTLVGSVASSMDVEMVVSSSSDTAAAAAAAVSSGESASEPTAAASVVQGDSFFGGGAMTTYRALRAGLETARVWNQLCRHQPLFPGQSNSQSDNPFSF